MEESALFFYACEAVSTAFERIGISAWNLSGTKDGRRMKYALLFSSAVISSALLGVSDMKQVAQGSEEIDVSSVYGIDRLFINNRRYLGNKFKLTEFIRNIVDENCEDVKSFVDIFAGTGSVAAAFADKTLIVNDILYSNYICHIAWFSKEAYSEEKIARIIMGYNKKKVTSENYMSMTFADTYFSKEDCKKIGFIREDIESLYHRGQVNARERALLVTSLLYAMDKIANTVGHYDAYRKNGEFEGRLLLKLPTPPDCKSDGNMCYREDANKLAEKLGQADVVFLDPPYNSRQYSDAYHLLENVAEWKKPEVHGVARKMDRSAIKSDYCTRKAEDAFADLVKKIKARYIVLTYNNMASKGNDRSNARLSDAAIMKILRGKGTVRVFTCEHKAFTTGKSSRTDNVERVFLCECSRGPVLPCRVASPLNYTGGKFRILDQMLPLFPTNINTFVDLFCGGANVGANVPASRVVFLDNCEPLVNLLSLMKRTSAAEFESRVRRIIKEYGLSESAEFGYTHYGCNSAEGLASYNRGAYNKLRKYYASLPRENDLKAEVLYTLIAYSFNNQVRFNNKGEFNLPVGKRDFNSKMQSKLRSFMNRLSSIDCEFRVGDFRQLDISRLGEDDFVYADPPYLVTTATYNERGGWGEKDERDLLALLDRIDSVGCGFALSNVTESKGKHNMILIDWIEMNKGRYHVYEIDRDYSNSNYHRQDVGKTREVLVTNKAR